MASPTESELKLLRGLWSQGQQSARELHDATSAQTGWSYSTTRKMLDRMVEKNLVQIERVHGLKTYQATEPRLNTLAGLIRRFTRNVLAADGPIQAATFVQSPMIDEGDLEELQRLLSDSDKEAHP
ncbi:MAG: BlaI/MecI/CopY family transcriptional regulator [Parvularcula sp.]